MGRKIQLSVSEPGDFRKEWYGLILVLIAYHKKRWRKHIVGKKINIPQLLIVFN